MNSWEELCQDGFTTIDTQWKIAVKIVQENADAIDLMKDTLINSYIEYLIKSGKEED